jgi:CRISPR-associated protein Csd1
VRALLLADKADYVLGYTAPGKSPERVSDCHEAFVDLIDRCVAATQEPAVLAVQRFLADDPLAAVELPEQFDPGGTITFRVEGVFPIDLPAVQEFWVEQNSSAEDIMQCVVCGQEKPVLKRLQAKIKGVPGGQTSGTSIISANADAFTSYGLEASLVSPTCGDCGERFTKAANWLLASEANSIRIGGIAFIFWTREQTVFNFMTYFSDPQPEQVRDLIGSVRSGRRKPEIDDTPFYATSLSGSGGRAVVRDWLDTTVGQVQRSLAVWFQRQEVVTGSGEPHVPLGIRALAFATVREPRDLATPTARALLRGAMSGTPLPWDLLFQAVRRNRAEQRVTRPRAALIKLVLLSQQREHKEDYMVQLDPGNRDPAYLCGRLMAVLENAQQAAIPGVNTTVVDRFYGTASTAPVSVFSRLLSGVQPHLAKLRRDNRGAYIAIQARMEEILSGLSGDTGFPRTFTLQEQGIFALGYYHQRAQHSAQMREAVERRRQNESQ